jgi:branched-chain amino acid aminotransferase
MTMPSSRPGQILWRNGAYVSWDEALVHVNAVGHASVSAAFEGVHCYWSPSRGQLLGFRLRDHMQRLLDSLRLGWLEPAFDADELVGATVGLLRRNAVLGQDIYVRPWGFAAGLHREQMVEPGTLAEVVIDSWAFQSKLGSGRTCSLAVTTWQKPAPVAAPSSMKVFANYHTGRLGTIDARARGADWPVFLNASGDVTESSGACLAVVRDGVMSCPDDASGVLDSITRRTVFTLAGELGIPVERRRIERTELYRAEEVMLLGTSAEVLPVTAVDRIPVGGGQSAGPVTLRLEARYHDVVRGAGGHEEWLTAIPAEETHLHR